MYAVTTSCPAAKLIAEEEEYDGRVDWNLCTKLGGSLLGLVRATVDRTERLVTEVENSTDDAAREQLQCTLEQLIEFECLLEEREAVYEEWQGPFPDDDPEDAAAAAAAGNDAASV